MKDYYKILNLPTNCSQKKIRKRYLKKSSRIHPKSKSKTRKSKDGFILLTEAANVLLNPESRKKYDLLLELKEKDALVSEKAIRTSKIVDIVALRGRQKGEDYAELKYKEFRRLIRRDSEFGFDTLIEIFFDILFDGILQLLFSIFDH